jgi:hypothetical protein
MYKKIHKSDFEETLGAMNKTSIYDAIVYAGVNGKSILTQEEYRTVISKKRKMVRSDIKHQRNYDKIAKKMDWK